MLCKMVMVCIINMLKHEIYIRFTCKQLQFVHSCMYTVTQNIQNIQKRQIIQNIQIRKIIHTCKRSKYRIYTNYTKFTK